MYDHGFFGDDRKTPATAPLPMPGPGICTWMAPLDLAATRFPWLATNRVFQWAESAHHRAGKWAGLR